MPTKILPASLSLRHAVLVALVVWALALPVVAADLDFFSPDVELVFERMTVNDGLPENSVRSILQDNAGFLWFGTMNGLVRYDGYELTVFSPSQHRELSFGGRSVLALHEDRQGDIWIGTLVRGLWRYDAVHGTFHQIDFGLGDEGSANVQVVDITEDSRGTLWVVLENALISLDRESGAVRRHEAATAVFGASEGSPILTSVMVDRQDRVWCCSERAGISVYVPATGQATWYHRDPDRDRSLPSDEVYDSLQTVDGKIWLATGDGLAMWQEATREFVNYDLSGGGSNGQLGLLVRIVADGNGLLWLGAGEGLCVFDPGTGRSRHFVHDPLRSTTPVKGPVLSLFIDDSGILWAGSFHTGMSKVNPSGGRFQMRRFPSPAAGGGDLSVESVLEDRRGSLWVGTSNVPRGRGDGVLYRRQGPDKPFQRVEPLPGTGRLSAVRSMLETDDGRLLVGTVRGGWRVTDAGLVPFALPAGPEAESLRTASLQSMAEGPDGRIWIATFGAGLFSWDASAGKLTRYVHRLLDPHSISDDDLTVVKFDRTGRLWIGSDFRGLNLFRSDEQGFQRFFAPEQGLETISSVIEFPDGALWLGTFAGLVRFDPATASTRVYGRRDGLVNEQIGAMAADGDGRLWLATGFGMVRFDPRQEEVKIYNQVDGLPDNELKVSAIRGSDGIMRFAGYSGLVSFDPRSFNGSGFQPPVAITHLVLADTSVVPAPDGPLTALPHQVDRIILHHDQNDFAIVFASLDFGQPEQNRYRHRLVGSDGNWRVTGPIRRATYSNLPPGDYHFEAQGTNRDGKWSERLAGLDIRILPPWWRTWWAYLLYTLAASLLVVMVYRQLLQRQQMRSRLEIRRAEATQLQELDRFKSRFLANITHEFRTPLTLIKTPLLRMQTEAAPETAGRIRAMVRNADRLEQLIDQLLDLSRLEAGRLPLTWRCDDWVGFLRNLAGSFEPLASQRRIVMQLEFQEGGTRLWSDADVLEKILGNLLSNALKFTPEGGSITVTVTVDPEPVQAAVPRFVEEPGGAQRVPGHRLTIVVANTGTFIPPADRIRIFDRFYQAGSGGGSGIGLALVKELASWFDGDITVASDPGTGTAFKAVLPLFESCPGADAEASPEAEIAAAVPDGDEDADPESEVALPEDDERRILIVEDNAELRAFVREEFEDDFNVLEAENGREGLRIAIEEIPDLVLSDVMMPEMDGFELCRALKEDDRTSHIPVILLTARSEVENRHMGLRLGADDYLGKPFDADDLRLRVHNLIEQRRRLATHFGQGLSAPTVAVAPVVSADERLISRLREVIDENLDDADFKINALCNEVGMSRSQLHRKLTAISGKSTSDFVRTHRVRRAAELFDGGYGNVTEVAYAVGFKNLSYFSRSFKEVQGVQPSEYLRRNEK